MQEVVTFTTVRTSERIEETIRSEISTASSGYCFVSADKKKRKSIPDFFPEVPPEEPPPDYDESPTHTPTMPSHVPLLTNTPKPTNGYEIRPAMEMPRAHFLQPVPRPSKTSDVSSPCSPLSHLSTQDSEAFIYTNNRETSHRGQKKCCKPLSLREKILVGVIVILVILVIVLVTVIILSK